MSKPPSNSRALASRGRVPNRPLHRCHHDSSIHHQPHDARIDHQRVDGGLQHQRTGNRWEDGLLSLPQSSVHQRGRAGPLLRVLPQLQIDGHGFHGRRLSRRHQSFDGLLVRRCGNDRATDPHTSTGSCRCDSHVDARGRLCPGTFRGNSYYQLLPRRATRARH